jgi:DNA-nicking Smr family endonuclease
MAKDVDLFRAAMADVKPLKGRKKPVRKHAVVTKPKVVESLPARESFLVDARPHAARPARTRVPAPVLQ